MSKINAVRIVNLNYNNNSMKIDDEIFELGGESTLLALRNGGGKSVMVQVVMAPFVNKRYRDLKDRPFKDYFTSPSPTYILTEWVLDGGVGHVLIGMMVRKKTSYSDEDSENELDITNFVYEYGSECKYDIRNFPVVEEGEKSKRIKSYTSTKGLFEKLKKDKDIVFNYFDMGAAYQSKSYFNNLKQYKINHKEWESIIKKVNMKESGLSELFQEAKNVSGLVEKWFIKTVEDKLNREDNKVKNFSEIVKKYIYQYRENQSKIDKKEAIERFHLCAEGILKEAESFLEHRNTSRSLRNRIANLIRFLEHSLEDENARKEQLDLMVSDIEEQIKDIKYEEISFDIYDIEDSVIEINKEKEEKEEEASETYEKIEALKKQQYILECAKIYEEYVKASKDVQKYENAIEIIKEKNKDLEPERENIGFTLNKYYDSKEKEVSVQLRENEENIKSVKKDIVEAKNKIDEINKKLEENSRIKGELQSSINSFIREEERFNLRYKKSFARNLMGYYGEDFISKTALEYKEGLKKKEESLVNHKKLYEKKNIEIKAEERKRDDLIKELSDSANELRNMKNQKELLDDEIEKRKKIIRYINVDESKLFDSEHIISEFNSRITILKEEEKSLVIKLDKLEDERRRLQTGRTLEIPKEIEEKLRQRDIKIIYGMDWIKKNNYSEEKNIKLIENNPFLPYSLIMENEDLIKLEKEELGIFTSYPIPIVRRNSLASESKENMNGLCKLNEITFYVAFNNRLINEEELKKLLNEKQREIDALKEILELKKRDSGFYENNRSIIQFSTLNKEAYEKLQKEMSLKEEELTSKENSLNHIRDNIKEINNLIDKTNKAIRAEEKEIIEFKREIEDFNILIKRYEAYRIDREKLYKLEESIREIKNNKSLSEKDKISLEESQSNLQEGFRDLKEKLKKVQGNLNKYSQYNEGEIIKKDIEDLEARYESLSREISSDIKLLEDNLKDANERLKTKEEDLIFKSEEYRLNDDDYREVIYDRFKEEEIKREVKLLTKELEKIKGIIEKLKISLAKLESSIESLYKKIKEDFNKEKPKGREEITSRDFTKRIFEHQHKLEEIKKEKKVSTNIVDKLENNLSNLEEFKDFTITEEINIDVEVQGLKKYRGELQRDYRQSLEEEGKKRVDLNTEINKVARKPIFLEDDFFRKSLETIERSVDEPEVVIENLNITLDAHKALIEKLQADIDLITREKENVCQSLYEYILEVHNNIGKIDNNSSIKIRDRYVKMLNIILPDWESNSELYRIRVNDFVEALTMKALERLQNNENIEDLISKSINTCDIYNEVVSISNIDVKLYKIEEDRQIQITWDIVARNSGGEGFLSAFVILSSLLSYMRRDETDIFASNQDGKVIIMDNPFAQTSSAHLLKPFMDIAKKSNTQLICLSDLGGDSIYNRFDNIYVLNLISSKLKSGLKYLKSDHVKGEENIERIVSSRFKMEEVAVEQMEFF